MKLYRDEIKIEYYQIQRRVSDGAKKTGSPVSVHRKW